jgi:peptidoglycan/xylan/chitin deacetylase (PgdA/CDA1 family)
VRFAVPVRAFERQLDLVRAEGLRGCSIASAIERPAGSVALSFDDGEAGNYEHAFPALVARDMTATFFITTSWVGRPGYVTWDQLREMSEAGMSIQSHTRTHPFLSGLGREELLEELEGSKRELDAALDQDTDAVALPGGDEPRADLRHLLGAAGYRIVATSAWGVNDVESAPEAGRPVRILRCTVRGEPSPSRFRRILRGNRWMMGWQRARGGALRRVRSGLGPQRYAALRRTLLDSLTVFR